MAASALTDASGAYQLTVEIGAYDVRLTPPIESGTGTWARGSRPGAWTAECDDGAACTVDACVAGVCTQVPVACVDDGNPARKTCALRTGPVACPRNGPCDDGNACSAGDSCDGGVCAGSGPPPCPDDGNSCTADVCDPATGACGVPAPGTCDDGDPCTAADRCAAGRCVGDAGEPDPFAWAACELGRVPAATCDPGGVDSGLAARLDGRTDKALAFLADAADADTPARELRAITHADRQLDVLLKRIKRARPDRVPDACKSELTAIVQEVRRALARLDSLHEGLIRDAS